MSEEEHCDKDVSLEESMERDSSEKDADGEVGYTLIMHITQCSG